MNRLLTIIGLGFFLFVSSTTLGQVELKLAPLTWKQAALTDGGELYTELCAVCHGTAGKGDGPAAGALNKPVSDLTNLATNNGGTFPQDQVNEVITGKKRVQAHGTFDMPIWGREFEALRPDWRQDRRRASARQKIFNLTMHVESLQAE